MPRRRTSRKATRARRTRRRKQRGGAISDAIVGSEIIAWLISLQGNWQDSEWKGKKFYEEGWPTLEVKDPSSDVYQFTLPGYMRSNVYSIVDIVQRPGSLGRPTDATEYAAILAELKQQEGVDALTRYVDIENILRNKLNVTEMITADSILKPEEQSLLLWFLANAVKEIPEDAITPIAQVSTRSSTGSSEQPAQPAK